MTSTHKNVNKGVLLIFLSSIMFGSYGLWSKLMGNSFGPFYQGWTRGLVISLILIPILFIKKQIIPINKKDWSWFIVFLVFTSGTQAPIYYAFTHMDIGSASLLFFAMMLITMYCFGFIFLDEKITKLKIISLVTALLGLYTIYSFSVQKFSLIAALMAIVNGIASGGEVSSSKKLSGSYSPLFITLMSWLIIIPTNGLLSLALGEKQLIPGFQIYWLWQIGYISVSLFAFWFVIAGLKYVEASTGGLIGLLEIIFSVIFGIVLFGEHLTQKVFIGAILILFAASLPHLYVLIKRNTKV